MNLFNIAAALTLNSAAYEKGLADAENSASEFGSKLKSGLGTAAKVGGAAIAAVGAGAIAVGKAFISSSKETAAYGDNIDKMSQRLGLSSTAYQEWDYVLGQAGVEINNVSVGMKTMTNQIDEAKNGSEKATAMFERLGISLEDLQSMSREDVFAAVVSGFQGMADSTERAALANDMFGRSGQELTPLFNATVDETNELREAAHEMGFVLSEEAVKAAADYTDAADTLSRTLGGLKNSLTSNFLPAITQVMDGLADLFAGNSDSGLVKIGEGVENLVNGIAQKLPEFLQLGVTIISGIASALIDNLPLLAQAALDIVQTLAGQLIDNLPTIVESVLILIEQIADSIGKNLPVIIPAIVSAIVQIAKTLIKHLPELLSAVFTIIKGLARGIIDALPVILEALPEIIQGIVDFVLEAIPQIIELVFDIVEAIIEALPQIIETIVTMIPQIIDGLLTAIMEAIPLIVDAGIQLITSLVDALPEIIGTIVEAIPQIIDGILDAIMTALPLLIQAGITLLVALIDALPTIITTIVKAIPDIIDGIISALTDNLPALIEMGIQLFVALVEALPDIIAGIVKAIPEIIEGIVTAIGNLAYKLVEAGKNLLHGLWEGISGAASWLWDKVKGWASDLLGKVKNFFGIHSPSTIMRDIIGKNLDYGLADGIDKYSDIAIGAMERLSEDILDAAEISPELDISTTADNAEGGFANGRQQIVQNIYAQKQTPAELFEETLIMIERAGWVYV